MRHWCYFVPLPIFQRVSMIMFVYGENYIKPTQPQKHIISLWGGAVKITKSKVAQSSLLGSLAFKHQASSTQRVRSQTTDALARFKQVAADAFAALGPDTGATLEQTECTPYIHNSPKQHKLWDVSDDKILGLLRADFLAWSRDEKYIVFRHVKTGKLISLLASKRGNHVYANRASLRLDILKYAVLDGDFFNRDFSIRGPRSTSLVLQTLTYDPNKISRSDAWNNLAGDYNRFMSRVRKLPYMPSVAGFRGNEAQANGYPHIHVLLSINGSVPVVAHRNPRTGKKTWRVSRNIRDDLQRCWSHGHSDILAMYSARGAISYVGKYITKGLRIDSDHDDKALSAFAIQWAKGLRAFSFSKNFIKNLGGRLERALHNSNSQYEYFGTFPPCFFDCLKLRGEIPKYCPYIANKPSIIFGEGGET